jgi:hypothetical protein
LAQARPPVWLILRSRFPTCDVRGRGPGDLAAGACNEQRPDPTENPHSGDLRQINNATSTAKFGHIPFVLSGAAPAVATPFQDVIVRDVFTEVAGLQPPPVASVARQAISGFASGVLAEVESARSDHPGRSPHALGQAPGLQNATRESRWRTSQLADSGHQRRGGEHLAPTRSSCPSYRLNRRARQLLDSGSRR